MATEKFYICIGYSGMTLQYHVIEVVKPGIAGKTPVVEQKFKPIPPKNIMLSMRRKFFRVNKPQKISKNYEGQGKNKR